jgi:uracil phosphoribosyltransferase
MLEKADQAYVVVGDTASRSKSMDAALKNVITKGLDAHQIVLSASESPRPNPTSLPRYKLNHASLDLLFKRPFIHAMNRNARKLLQTPTRDAVFAGHDLRKAHEQVGYYLAVEFLGDLLGVEVYAIRHTNHGMTDGYRFQHEKDTLIVPLMRGGDLMAFGVSKALKSASFAHAREYQDIVKGLLSGKRTIILVDSVINSGSSIVKFLIPLREEYPDVRVVVVTGVVQAAAVETTEFARMLEVDGKLTLVALRKSGNKYVGSGASDTEDRLFNTSYLEKGE